MSPDDLAMTRGRLARWLTGSALASVGKVTSLLSLPRDQAIAEQAGLSAVLSLAVEEIQALGDAELAARVLDRRAAAISASNAAADRVEPEYRDVYRAAHLSGALRVILDMVVRELRDGER